MNATLKSWLPELWRSYPIPLLAMVAATPNIDPWLGVLFSAHGGLGWFLILLALPWVVVRIAKLLLSKGTYSKQDRTRRALVLASGYVLVTLLSCSYLAWRPSPPLDLSLANTLPWYYFPFSLLFEQ
jgi:hypothetical protein